LGFSTDRQCPDHWAAGSRRATGAAGREAVCSGGGPAAGKELIKLIKHNKNHLENVAKEVQTRGTDFEFTPDIVKQLNKAGATDQLVTYMKQFTPSARAARKSKLGGGEISPEEAETYNKLKNSKDPDTIIKASDSFTAQYPKSSLLTYVYALEASAYQQKTTQRML